MIWGVCSFPLKKEGILRGIIISDYNFYKKLASCSLISILMGDEWV